jgi:polar amino acid transport system substrate-binding protein
MPYQHIDQNGRLTGLDVELIQAIFNKMGCQLEYREVPWKQLLPAIKRGQISLAAGASKSKQRMTYAYFSNAYRTESVVLFFRKGEKYPIKKISDIIKTDLTIGIIKGNYYGKTFEKLMKNKDFNRHVQFVNNDTINIKKTLNSRIDGFLIDKFAGISAINKYGAYNLFQIHPIPISSEDIHVMFSKKACQPIDVKRFNEALDILKKNGVLNSIIHKYFQ